MDAIVKFMEEQFQKYKASNDTLHAETRAELQFYTQKATYMLIVVLYDAAIMYLKYQIRKEK